MNIDVTKDEVIIDKNSDKAHENEYKITECHFTFDDFTNSFQVKRAIFTILSTGEKYEIDIINNKCDIPIEVLGHAYETVKLGVYGYNIEIVDEEETLKERFSPSYDTFVVPTGSYEDGALSPEIITPSQYDIYSQALQEGLQEVDDKLDEVVETVDGKLEEVDTKLGEVDTKLEVVDEKIEDVDDAITRTDEAIARTNNLNLDVSDKVDGDVTVTLTKKDASTKSVVISDGTSLQFMWQGTSLGIKTDDMEEYVFVDLQGIQGIKGDTGEPFTIKKTYSSVAEMNADFNNMEYGDYVMIASSVEVEDNAKLYTRGESQWIFITDFSGATGIRGPVGATPNIQIGTVTSGSAPSVTRTGTDENPILNFVLQPGPQGEVGPTGLTGNGISSITKTGTSGLVDTYTITFTNGNTTTFDVTNGKGIDRIEKTATVGNIDTYTIYFNDNSTSTFEVANGEVTREELEEEVDRLSMIYNLFPTTSDEDTEMTLDGTGEVKLKKIGLKGNTYQESTTGKNMLGLVDGTYGGEVSVVVVNGEITLNGTATVNRFIQIPLETSLNFTNGEKYTISVNNPVGDGNVRFRIDSDGTLDTTLSTIDRINTITYNNEPIYTNGITIRITSGTTLSNFKMKPQIEAGNSATSWEKFTGRIPAPNPDYPQDIEVVSGDNNVNVEGKNRLNLSDFVSITSDSGITVTNDATTGKVVLNGTATKNTFITYKTQTFNSGDIVSLSANNQVINSNVAIRLYNINSASTSSNVELDAINKISNNITLTKIFDGFQIRITSGTTLNNFTLYPMIEKSSTASSYEKYKSQTYSVNLPVKNLFDNSLMTEWSSTIRYISVNVDKNTDYTLSTSNPGLGATSANVFLSTSNSSVTSNVNGAWNNKPRTINSGNNNIIYVAYRGDIEDKTQYWYQLEKGSKANSYTAYGTTPIELCKIGDYQDYIYKEDDKWYIHKDIGKDVLDGSENWELRSDITSVVGYKVYRNKSFDYTLLGNTNYGLSNYFKYVASGNIPNTIRFLQTSQYAIHCVISEELANDTTAFKTWLSTHNTDVYYILATPTITEITDTTLIEQLDNLENAYSYDTQTNIFQINADKPFIINVEAIMSLKNIFNS